MFLPWEVGTTGDEVSGSLQIKARGNLGRGHTREINGRFCSCVLTLFLLLERKENGLERWVVHLSVNNDVFPSFCSWFLSRAQMIWGAAEEAGEAHPGENEAHGGPSHSIQLSDRRLWWVEMRLWWGSLLPSNKQQAKRKWPQVVPGMFRFDVMENYFSERVVKPRNRLPKAVVESPSLNIFKGRVDVALRDVGSCRINPVVGLMADLEDFSQPKWSNDSVIIP